MKEVENDVEVTITGPEEEVSMYIKWLKTTGEYVYSTGRSLMIEDEDQIPFVFTPPIQEHLFWNFSSSNLKRKVFLYERFHQGLFKFRVNYIVYYGSPRLSQESDFYLNEKDYERAIYPELVHIFQPLPYKISRECPNLKASVTWGSYYIEDRYLFKGIEEQN